MRRFILPAIVLALAGCSDRADTTPEATASGADAFPEQPPVKPAGRFAPQNECVELPGAKQFFIDLGNAVRERDADGLLALTDKGVKLDFGGGGGLTTFRERLADKDGELWQELDRILVLGCATDRNGNMVLPWYFVQDLGVDDPFSVMLVTDAGVPLLDAASTDAPTARTISWDTVTLVDGYDAEAKFLKVESRDGTQGYIAADKLRSLVDYRLSAARAENDEWRIVSFVAGD